jgi:Uma2 family endonuclease
MSTPLTAEEFAARHAGDYVELIDGRVVPIEPAGARNGYICGNVAWLFGRVVYEDRSWVACSNDTFVLTGRNPDRVRGADFVLWRRDVVPLPIPDLVPTPPELVVEVRRPIDTIADLLMKTGEYLLAGVRVVVLLDPKKGHVGVFRDDELPYRLEGDQELTLPDILPGFAVPVRRFFE